VRQPGTSAAAFALTGLLLSAAAGGRAQELEPRAYSPNPTGANFVVLGYGHSKGDVVFDASLPVQNVEAKINTTSLLYGRTFGVLGRSASAGVALPYVWGSIEGEVAESFRRITRSGLADLRLRLAVNLVGGPAIGPRDFASRRPATTLGASLSLVAPTGQYDPAKLINLGSNRWSWKPELGLSHPRGRWVFELYGGAWFFTDNDNFYGGSRREQQPIGTLQGHVGYTFKPRLWLAGDATLYSGGRSTVDGVRKDDLQRNSRLGLTLALPVGRRHSIKFAWATGFTTRIGGDFDTLAMAWQYLWLD
jgi:Putative MetA-pathway of phenol degradation